MRSITLGWIAGLLSAAPALAAAALAPQQNLRQNGTPWALAAWALLLLLCVRGIHALHAHTGPSIQPRGRVLSLERLGYACLATALALVAAFFATLGLEDALSASVGLPRFLSDNEAITALGTLTASLSSLVLLPLGLLLFGIATLRRRALPGWGRPLPLVFAALLVLTALAAASSESALAATVCLLLAAAGSFLLGLALRRASTSPPSAKSRSESTSTAGCDPAAATLV